MDWADGVLTNPFVIVWRIDDCQGGESLLGSYLSCQWKWRILYRGRGMAICRWWRAILCGSASDGRRRKRLPNT